MECVQATSLSNTNKHTDTHPYTYTNIVLCLEYTVTISCFYVNRHTNREENKLVWTETTCPTSCVNYMSLCESVRGTTREHLKGDCIYLTEFECVVVRINLILSVCRVPRGNFGSNCTKHNHMLPFPNIRPLSSHLHCFPNTHTHTHTPI